MTTRWFQNPTRVVRDPERNLATRMPPSMGERWVGSFQDAFVWAYPRIRAAAGEFGRNGVGVFAVHLANHSYLGALCLASRGGELVTGVVGRHSQCPLLLEAPAVALRHLVCVVEPPSVEAEIRGDVRFRLIDAGTGGPPVDEHGRKLAAITAEGPVVLRLGNIGIFALPTGDPTDWPDDGLDAWQCLPERVYLQERLAEGSGPRVLPTVQVDPRQTRITVSKGPVRLAPAAHGEPTVGRLEISVGERMARFPVSHEGLRRGMLLGRYERCQATGAVINDDNRISRVHAILLEVGGTPWLIDTASTGGLWVGEEQRGVVDLARHPEVTLGEEEIRLVYR